MRKLLLIVVCCLCLCGCGEKNDWKDKVQVSQLKLDDNYLIGKIKNTTDKFYDITIIFKLKSGTLEDTDVCYEIIRPNENKNLKCLVYDIDDTYIYEIKDIELTEKEIPVLLEGNIDINALEYYFEKIYEAHQLNFIAFSTDIIDTSFPYISKIKYKDNEITIIGDIIQGSNKVSYIGEYDTTTNDLNRISFYESRSNDKSFTDSLITRISLMNSIATTSKTSLEIGKALLRTDIEEGYCVIVDNWCVSTIHDDLFNTYLIVRK